MTAVNAAPARTPRSGFSNVMSICWNSGISERPETELDMAFIPNISVANPRRIAAVSFLLSGPFIIIMTVPIRATTGTNDVGLRSCSHILSLLMPLKLRIHAVMVVPTLEPMITLMACRRSMSPELTNPTTITVVAEELWMIAVMPHPAAKPVSLPDVIFSRSERSLSPARLSRALPMMSIPNRNRHNPPINDKISNMSIYFLSPFSPRSMVHTNHQICFIENVK